jgi:hypothetical protein
MRSAIKAKVAKHEAGIVKRERAATCGRRDQELCSARNHKDYCGPRNQAGIIVEIARGVKSRYQNK